MRSARIDTVQVLLRAAGHTVTVNGLLDDTTRVAIRAFYIAEKIDKPVAITDELLLLLAGRVATRCGR